MKKNESEIIMKVTTDFKQGEVLFHIHAQFLTRAYEILGVTMFVEEIAGGAIFFYRSVQDFERFHEFSLQVPISPPEPAGTPATSNLPGEKIFTVTIVFVRRPPDLPIEVLLKTIERAHRRITPNIDLKLLPPNTILMHYKTVGVFSTAFLNVGEVLRNKITPSGPRQLK